MYKMFFQKRLLRNELYPNIQGNVFSESRPVKSFLGQKKKKEKKEERTKWNILRAVADGLFDMNSKLHIDFSFTHSQRFNHAGTELI